MVEVMPVRGNHRIGGSTKSGAPEPYLSEPLVARHEHRGSPRPMRVGLPQVYENALAAIFSRLFQPANGAKTDASGLPPEGRYLLATALLAARRPADAAPVLQHLTTVAASRPDQWQWRRRTEFLWAVHAEQTADIVGVLDHVAAAPGDPGGPAELPSEPDGVPASLSGLHAVDAVVVEQLPLLAARAHLRLGDPQHAASILEDRYGTLEQAAASQPGTLAMLACRQGRLHEAMRLATTAVLARSGQDNPTELVDIEARLVLAEVSYEHNDLEAAQEQLEAALQASCLHATTPWMWAVEIDLVRVLIAQERAGETLHRLACLRRIGDSGLLPYPLGQKLSQVEIDCRLQLGDLEGALLMVNAAPARDLSAETLARLDLHSGRPDRVLARLSTAKSADPGVEIRRLVLLARAEQQQGRAGRAADAMRRAVEAAQTERYVRPFLEEPTQTLPLLRGISGLSADPYLSRLMGQANGLAADNTSHPAATMLEPLTERERQVLQHLPTHLNLRQIAIQMCVSTNTVKTHVKAIYRKTGAISRYDAVSIARGHGLL